MPVGTYGTVKGMTPEEVEALARKLSSATPSTCGCARARNHETARRSARFYAVEGADPHDSGGFQVFSLGDIRKITEQGCTSVTRSTAIRFSSILKNQ